ncbi:MULTISPECIES: hypothetical protein [Streptomyces]|uniref:Uncharacterized protein n=1 Tax=Streptomyces koelreuteriae TaxID=2838015 RepID=A0ABX8FPJ2_9ACTN|nr:MULTISPECIES: hypothetical protein [Streptomyces]QWB23024.1 hypothetical protein KJK29_10695 [Streptomyces koelreuteriae]UUA05974.1 hypothetical protein NNW98_10750 [Streptomyces koelreuteriae]UUA13602.1 hypothetical protein NNW99_10750 [Streptomyces sp. CRCS-T-1]
MTEETGLSWVAAECDDLEDLPVEELDCLAERGPVEAMLCVAERAVAVLSQPAAVRLGQDVRRLMESSLPDATIRTVWLGATDHVFDPAKDGISTRTWLWKMEQAWLTAERRNDPAFISPPAAPETDERLRRDVLQAIGRIDHDLTGAVENRIYPLSLPGLVPALELVTVRACADLGYRMVLRALKANYVAVDAKSRDMFVELGSRFGHARSLVTKDLNHQA